MQPLVSTFEESLKELCGESLRDNKRAIQLFSCFTAKMLTLINSHKASKNEVVILNSSLILENIKLNLEKLFSSKQHRFQANFKLQVCQIMLPNKTSGRSFNRKNFMDYFELSKRFMKKVFLAKKKFDLVAFPERSDSVQDAPRNKTIYLYYNLHSLKRSF